MLCKALVGIMQANVSIKIFFFFSVKTGNDEKKWETVWRGRRLENFVILIFVSLSDRDEKKIKR